MVAKLEWLTAAASGDETVAYAVFRYFLAPFLLLLVGGIAANILYPRWQDTYLRRKSAAERRGKLGEDVVSLMNQYVVNWRRLIDCANYANDCLNEISLKEDEVSQTKLQSELQFRQSKTEEAAKNRNETRDGLMSSLTRFSLYCSKKDRTVIKEFLLWDEAQAKKTLDELPKIKEWWEWEERLANIVSDAIF